MGFEGSNFVPSIVTTNMSCFFVEDSFVPSELSCVHLDKSVLFLTGVPSILTFLIVTSVFALSAKSEYPSLICAAIPFTKATTAPTVDANDKTTGNVKRGTVATIGYISKNVKGAGNTLALDLTVLGTIKCADTDDASNTERTYGTLGVVKLSEIGDKYTINGKAISTYGFSNN